MRQKSILVWDLVFGPPLIIHRPTAREKSCPDLGSALKVQRRISALPRLEAGSLGEAEIKGGEVPYEKCRPSFMRKIQPVQPIVASPWIWRSNDTGMAYSDRISICATAPAGEPNA